MREAVACALRAVPSVEQVDVSVWFDRFSSGDYQITSAYQERSVDPDNFYSLVVKTDAGANSIDSISFDLADPRTHRAEAIAAAAANARSDAAALAGAADLKLLHILGISLDEAGWQPPIPLMSAGRMAMAETAMAPPIEPGEIIVRAGVTIVYEIGSLGKE